MLYAATGLLIYNSMTKPHYARADDTIVEEFKEWHVKNDRQRDALNAFKGAYWSIVVGIYLFVSFLFGIWSFSWILFIMAAAVENIIKGVVALRRQKHGQDRSKSFHWYLEPRIRAVCHTLWLPVVQWRLGRAVSALARLVSQQFVSDSP